MKFRAWFRTAGTSGRLAQQPGESLPASNQRNLYVTSASYPRNLSLSLQFAFAAKSVSVSTLQSKLQYSSTAQPPSHFCLSRRAQCAGTCPISRQHLLGCVQMRLCSAAGLVLVLSLANWPSVTTAQGAPQLAAQLPPAARHSSLLLARFCARRPSSDASDQLLSQTTDSAHKEAPEAPVSASLFPVRRPPNMAGQSSECCNRPGKWCRNQSFSAARLAIKASTPGAAAQLRSANCHLALSQHLNNVPTHSLCMDA